jgi:hypothetical protein
MNVKAAHGRRLRSTPEARDFRVMISERLPVLAAAAVSREQLRRTAELAIAARL